MTVRTTLARVRLRPHDVLAIVGKRGTGKSTAAKRVLEMALSDGHRVVAFDPHDEYSRHGRDSGQVRLGPLDDRASINEVVRDPEALDWDVLSLSVVPRTMPQEVAEDFGTLARLCAATGDLVLCVDEVGYFGHHAREQLDWLATQSRHYSVPLVLVAQRLTQIPKTARTQITQLLSFRQDNPDDLAALGDLTNSNDFATAVSRLGRGEHLQWREQLPPAGKKKEKRTP